MFGVFAGQEASVGYGTIEMVEADVIRAALQQRGGNRNTQRLDDGGNIAAKKLVLEIFGAGRNDHLAARLQRGNEVGVSLAGTGAGLRDQHPGALDGSVDFLRHFDLALTVAKSFNTFGERPVRAKDGADF